MGFLKYYVVNGPSYDSTFFSGSPKTSRISLSHSLRRFISGERRSSGDPMAGMQLPAEESDVPPPRAPVAGDLVSDDERSVAADSWSIKSEYGSTLDDEQRQVDAADLLPGFNFPTGASDYSSDKDGSDANETEASLLGLQSYWDASYAEDLSNFQQHGHAGEIWFGNEVMETVASWTKILCLNVAHSTELNKDSNYKSDCGDTSENLSSWSVLDIGSGNGLLLHELGKLGFTNLTGTDYVEGAVVLAQNLASRNGFENITFVVDDILETKLDRKVKLVMDKGTLDAIGLHPDGPIKRIMYWESVSKLVAPGGILVITSCNNTKDELSREVENFNQKKLANQSMGSEVHGEVAVFQYLDHVRTYPTFRFGGVEGSRVCTVAFRQSGDLTL